MIGQSGDDSDFDRDHAEQGRRKALSELDALRMGLVVLRDSVTAAAEDFRAKAKSEKTRFHSPTASMEGLAQKIALGSSALSHQAFAVQIQNILDGRDP